MANNQTKIIITAQDDTKAAFGSVQSSLNLMKSTGASVQGALTALGIGLSAGYFQTLISGSIDSADHLNDLSKSTGITVEQLSGLGIAAKKSGGDLDSIAASMNKLSVNMGKDPEKFAALGVDAKSPLEALKQLADIFTKIEDPQLRAAVAAAALGKAWAGTAPLLAEGGKKIGEMVSKGSELSGVTTEIAQQADSFNDKLVDLTKSGGLLTRMVGPMLPLLNSLADDMLAVGKGAKDFDKSFSPLAETLKAVVVLGANVSFVFKTLGDDIGRAAVNLQLIAKGDFAASRSIGESSRKDAEDRRKALDEYEKKVMGMGLTGIAEPGERPDPSAAAAAAEKARRFLEEKNRANEEIALQKRLISAMQQMEEKRRALFGETEQQTMQRRLESGTYMEFNTKKMNAAGVPAKFMNMASELDQRKQMNDLLKANEISLSDLYKAVEDQNAIKTEGIFADQEYNKELQFQLSLIGKTAVEQQKMNEIRKIDLDLQRKLRDAALAAGENTFSFDKTREELIKRADQQKKSILDSVDARISAERAWSTGAAGAMDDYLSHATNAAEQSRTLFTNAFKGMEDALVSFVKTGKLDFKSLADSMITDLIRIQVQNQIMKPLVGTNESPGLLSQGISSMAGGVGSFFSNLFGGGRASGGPVSPGQYYVVGENGPEILMPRTSGLVIPNGGSAGGAASANNFTINFNVVTNDAGSFRSSLAANKNVIIGVIREAALKGARQSPI